MQTAAALALTALAAWLAVAIATAHAAARIGGAL
jgi:hypothetical protein